MSKRYKTAIKADLEEIMPLLIGVWRRYRKTAGPSDVLQTREFRRIVEKVLELRQTLDKSGIHPLPDYFAADEEILGAYLLYDWVVHYQEGLSLLGELPSPPKKVLDLCSGAAPFAFAALKHGAREVTAMDQNLKALQLGAEICGRYGFPLNIRRWNCLKEPFPLDQKFDLIIVGHGLLELFPSQQKHWRDAQQQFIQKLLSLLTPQGFLLLVDQSNLEANKRLLEIRDQFVKEGIAVQAPCVWRGECPALKTANSPCYAQREFEKPYLVKEIQRAAQINLSSLKMSYILFRSPGQAWPELPMAPLHRVISPPIDAFHGKRFYLCGTDGKRTLSSRLASHPKESRAFEYLKRGELIHVENSAEKDMAMDVVEETKIQVIAPLGKPLPEDSNTKE